MPSEFKATWFLLGFFLGSYALAQNLPDEFNWLEVPKGWQIQSDKNGLVLQPSNLSDGESLELKVSKTLQNERSVESAFQAAENDIGDWHPYEPTEVRSLDNGWTRMQASGVALINDTPFSATIVVLHKSHWIIQFRLLADSDATMERFASSFDQTLNSVESHP